MRIEFENLDKTILWHGIGIIRIRNLKFIDLGLFAVDFYQNEICIYLPFVKFYFNRKKHYE